MTHLFLSYSHTDVWVMRSVDTYLRGAGLPTWTDEHLQAGTPNWRKAVSENIKAAAGFVIIMTPTANESEWVAAELAYAQQFKVPIFPLLAGGTEDAVMFGLAQAQWVDIRTTFGAGMAKVVASMKANHHVVKALAQRPPDPRSGEIDWPKVGSVFWLGSDTQKVLLTLDDPTVSREAVLEFFAHAYHHLVRLNAPTNLLDLAQSVATLLRGKTGPLSKDDRKTCLNRVSAVLYGFASIAEKQDMGFDAGPRWKFDGTEP